MGSPSADIGFLDNQDDKQEVVEINVWTKKYKLLAYPEMIYKQHFLKSLPNSVNSMRYFRISTWLSSSIAFRINL